MGALSLSHKCEFYSVMRLLDWMVLARFLLDAHGRTSSWNRITRLHLSSLIWQWRSRQLFRRVQQWCTLQSIGWRWQFIDIINIVVVNLVGHAKVPRSQVILAHLVVLIASDFTRRHATLLPALPIKLGKIIVTTTKSRPIISKHILLQIKKEIMGWVITGWVMTILAMGLVMVPVVYHGVIVLYLVLYLHGMTQIRERINLIVPLQHCTTVHDAIQHLTRRRPVSLRLRHTSPPRPWASHLREILSRIKHPLLLSILLLDLDCVLTSSIQIALPRRHKLPVILPQVADDPARWWLLKWRLIHLCCLFSAAVTQ